MAAQSGPLSAAPPPGRGSGRLGTGRLTPAAWAGGEPPDEENEQELVEQEEQAVQTLKRLRTSGPLIIEGAMNNKDQMNEIIGQAVEGHLPDVQVSDEAEVDHQVWTPGGLTGAASGAGDNPQRISQVIKLDRVYRDAEDQEVDGSAMRDNLWSDQDENGESLPPLAGQGPAQVLADASGLQNGSSFGAWLRIGLTVVVLLISTMGYLVYRERLLGNAKIGDDERDLRTPLELSNEARNLGASAASAGNYPEALTYYLRARQLTKDDPEVLLGLARTYARLARLDEAQLIYTSLLGVAPGNLEARLEMARLHQSRNDWTSAHREYKIIIALDQNSAQASTALEEIENYQARQNGSVVPVRSIRKRPAKPLPLLPSPRIAPGEITLQPPRISLNTDFRPPESLDIGKSGEKPDPAAMVASRRDLGLRYLNIREYRAAIKEFLIVLRLTPEDKDIYYFLASAYHGLEMYPEAYDYYKRVDRGRYVQVAQSGAKRTQKLAADQQRRTNP